jgi:hypothetical protein
VALNWQIKEMHAPHQNYHRMNSSRRASSGSGEVINRRCRHAKLTPDPDLFPGDLLPAFGWNQVSETSTH